MIFVCLSVNLPTTATQSFTSRQLHVIKSQKGINAVQSCTCTIENQKGVIAVQSLGIVPFWFWKVHLWTELMPFWFSADEVWFDTVVVCFMTVKDCSYFERFVLVS